MKSCLSHPTDQLGIRPQWQAPETDLQTTPDIVPVAIPVKIPEEILHRAPETIIVKTPEETLSRVPEATIVRTTGVDRGLDQGSDPRTTGEIVHRLLAVSYDLL